MRIATISNLLVLPHSVFALPFALAGLLLAFREGRLVEQRFPLWMELGLVVVAVIAARSAAMGFNRLIDADLDARNPRTQAREIPAGKVTPSQTRTIVVCAAAIFFAASLLLGWHCAALAPFVLGVLLYYSYTKRQGAYAHLVLGLALAFAPGGAWWVFRPAVELTPILLMIAVLFWVAGFDILYSSQDVESDRNNGVHSIPSALGIEYSVLVAQWFHAFCVLAFVAVGISAELGAWYYVGVLVIALSLTLEHRLVSPFDLSRINHAFFTLNGVVSLAYLLFVVASV